MDKLIVGVTDTGPGIARDRLKSIFERFKQVDNDLKSSTKGFGLGLSIANELVALNLGEMSVESEIGHGSTFSFSLPQNDLVEVTQRYLETTLQKNTQCVSLVVATVDPATTLIEAADDIDTFVSHLVRGNDLGFRVNQYSWVFILPEPEAECSQFVARATKELQSVIRNRPRGELPEVDFVIDESWSNLQSTKEEVRARVRTFINESEPACA